MGGIGPKSKVAYVDALATADRELVYFHAINRSFEKPIDVTVDISALGRFEGRAVHHVLEGRLNDEPKSNEPRQIGRITQRDIFFEGNRLKITLPNRSISCIEFKRD